MGVMTFFDEICAHPAFLESFQDLPGLVQQRGGWVGVVFFLEIDSHRIHVIYGHIYIYLPTFS